MFKGHLFVGDVLLNDSGMQNHPLTPMTDANLVRVLQAQYAAAQGRADRPRVPWRAAPTAIGERIAQLRAEGVGIAIVDAVSTTTCCALGPALAGMPLVTAGSGLAIGIPATSHGAVADAAQRSCRRRGGLRAVVSGSCSAATNAQVADFIAAGGAAFALDPLRLAPGDDVAARGAGLGRAAAGDGPVLVYATADAGAVQAVQAQLGVETRRRAGGSARWRASRAGWSRPACGQLSWPAAKPRAPACRRWASRSCRSAPQIDPGVPWCHAADAAARRGLHLALKSGNFGGDRLLHQRLRRCCDSPTKPRCATRSAASAARCSNAAMCMPPPATSACGWTTAF